MTMLQETLALLKKDKRNSAQLARAAGVGYFWVVKLRNRKIANPGIVDVEKLHAVLKNVA